MSDDYSVFMQVGADDSGFQATAARVASSLNSWGLNFGKLYDKTSEFFKGFGIDVDKFAEKLGTTGPVLTGIVAVGAAVVEVGSVVVGAVDEMIDAFSGYEKKMAEVFTLMPELSAESRDKMMDDVDALAEKYGTLPEEVIPALYQAISAGVPQDNVFSFLATAQEAAIGGVSNLRAAVDGFSSVVNAYGADIISVQEVSDAMFMAVKDGKTTFDELSKFLYNVIPTAAAAGVSFDDVAASLAAITAQGTPTTVATTQLRQMLVELNKDGSKTSDLFKEIAGESFKGFIKSGGNVQDALILLEKYAKESNLGINDLFSSVEAGNAALQLTGKGTEKFSATLADMENKAGATSAAFNVMNDTLDASQRKFASMKSVLIKDVGEMFAPIKKGILDGMTELMKGVDDLVKQIAKIIKPLSEIFGKVFEVILKIAGEFISEIAYILEDATTWNMFIEIVETASRIIVNILDDLAGIFQGVFAIIGGILTGDWNRVWTGAQLVVLSAVKVILDVVSGMVNGVTGLINVMIEKVNPVLEKFGKSIPEIAELNLATMTGITQKVSDLSEELKTRVKKNTTEIETHTIESQDRITGVIKAEGEEQKATSDSVAEKSQENQKEITKTTEEESDNRKKITADEAKAMIGAIQTVANAVLQRLNPKLQESVNTFASLGVSIASLVATGGADIQAWGNVTAIVLGGVLDMFTVADHSAEAAQHRAEAAKRAADQAAVAAKNAAQAIDATLESGTTYSQSVADNIASSYETLQTTLASQAAAAGDAYAKALSSYYAYLGMYGGNRQKSEVKAAYDEMIAAENDYYTKSKMLKASALAYDVAFADRTTGATIKIQEAFYEAYRDAVLTFGATSDEVKAVTEYYDQLVYEALYPAAAALDSTNAKLEENKDLWRASTEYAARFDTQLSKITESAASFYDSLSNVGSTIGDKIISGLQDGLGASDFLETMKEYITNLVIQTAVYTEAMRDKIATIGEAIARGVTEGFSEFGMYNIKKALEDVYNQAASTAKVATDVISGAFASSSMFGLSKTTVGGYASGTEYATAGWHLVGEQGPEFAYVGQGTRVFNANDTAGMLGGGAKVITANFYSPLAMDQAAQIEAWRQTAEELAFEGVI